MKKTLLKQLIVGITIAISSISVNAQTLLDSLDFGQCGTSPEFGLQVNELAYNTINGLPYSSSTPLTYTSMATFTNVYGYTPITCGSFRIWYEDDIFLPAGGFNVGDPDGSDRRATLCSVLQYIEQRINIPAGTVLDLFVARSNSAAYPATNPTVFLARAFPYQTTP